MRQSVNATFLYCLRATPPRAKLSPVTPAPTAPPKSVGASRPVASAWGAAPSLSQSPGGQAGSSSKIENYLGFPTGVSGLELAARATTQAQKFGANMMIARSVVRLRCDNRPYQIELDTGELL